MSNVSVVLFGISVMFWAMTWLSNRASKKDRAANHQWWVNYENKAVRRHQEMMRALGGEPDFQPYKAREIN